MLVHIIKITIILYCTFTIQLTLLSNLIRYSPNKFLIGGISLCLSLIAYVNKLLIPEYSYIVLIMMSWLLIFHMTTHLQISFVTTIISFLASYALHVSISFIITIIVSLFAYNKTPSPYLTISILSTICQFLITSQLLQYNRLKNSLLHVLTIKHINLATIASFILLSGITPMPNKLNYTQKFFVLFLFIVPLAFLIYWWKAQLTKAYKQMVAQRNAESLRASLQGKEQEIIELTEQNHELGRLLHKYNKLIPALEHAICEYMASADEDINSIHEKGEELISSLRVLTADRKNMLSTLNSSNYSQYKTKISSLNAVLNYLSVQSTEQNIDFKVNCVVPLDNYIPHSIPENTFTHMVSDLLDNAFIAIRGIPSGRILLQFYVYADDLVLEIADNGIPFEVQSLANFGLKQITTHADSGGSGTGLMDIWKHKETCKASLHIEEYAVASPFTKKISIIFNHKNKYTISTYRKTDLQNQCYRLDLQIYEQTTES